MTVWFISILLTRGDVQNVLIARMVLLARQFRRMDCSLYRSSSAMGWVSLAFCVLLSES